MPFIFECPSCTRKIRTADQYAGMSRKCPECSLLIRIPDAAGEPASLIDEAPVAANEMPGPDIPAPDNFFVDTAQKPPAIAQVQTGTQSTASPTSNVPSGGTSWSSLSAADVGEFLKFRRFAAPLMVQMLFWGGVASILSSMIGTTILAIQIAFDADGGWTLAFFTFVGGIGGALLLLLLLRIFCETMLLLFRIHDQLRTLVQIQQAASSGLGNNAGQ